MHFVEKLIMKIAKQLGAGMFGLGLALMAQSALADVMTKPADGVTRVVFKTSGELSVKVGSEEKLTVEAEPKVLAQLDIGVKGGTMTLASKGSFKTDKGLKFTLTIKSLRALKSDGSGEIRIDGFGGNDLEVEAGGSSNIVVKNVKPGKLSLLIPGSGNIDAAGSGKALLARIGGSGNIDAGKFRAQTVEARIDGSGNIKVHADDTLKADISGAGNIEFTGKAKVTESITGAGSVDRL